jgi:hypothetical protein
LAKKKGRANPAFRLLTNPWRKLGVFDSLGHVEATYCRTDRARDGDVGSAGAG